jgi:hypothetical protein
MPHKKSPKTPKPSTPSFIEELFTVRKVFTTAAALHNLLLEKARSSDEKKQCAQFKTHCLGTDERVLTHMAQCLESLLKQSGFTNVSCGFPWADAAHTEYKSIDTLFITFDK